MSSKGFEFIADVAMLEQAVENMLTIVQECTFEFRDDELYLAAVGPSNIAMVHQHIDADAFEHYHASEMKLGVNLQRLSDYLGEINADTVEVTWDGEKNRLDIQGEEVYLSLAAIDPDSVRNRPDTPEIEGDLGTVLVTEGGALDHAAGVCEMMSDHVKFETRPDREAQFHMVAGGDLDDGGVEFDRSVISADYAEAAESLFNLDYITGYTSAIPTGAEVTLRHGDEFPTLLEWEFADGNAEVTMMLAPRIQEQ